jgi:hypothetical protein
LDPEDNEACPWPPHETIPPDYQVDNGFDAQERNEMAVAYALWDLTDGWISSEYDGHDDRYPIALKQLRPTLHDCVPAGFGKPWDGASTSGYKQVDDDGAGCGFALDRPQDACNFVHSAWQNGIMADTPPTVTVTTQGFILWFRGEMGLGANLQDRDLCPLNSVQFTVREDATACVGRSPIPTNVPLVTQTFPGWAPSYGFAATFDSTTRDDGVELHTCAYGIDDMDMRGDWDASTAFWRPDNHAPDVTMALPPSPHSGPYTVFWNAYDNCKTASGVLTIWPSLTECVGIPKYAKFPYAGQWPYRLDEVSTDVPLECVPYALTGNPATNVANCDKPPAVPMSGSPVCEVPTTGEEPPGTYHAWGECARDTIGIKWYCYSLTIHDVLDNEIQTPLADHCVLQNRLV